ncbi:MAG TPA: metalloregulator ArsR/SmtB family transcription factor [bacterium]|nr:metalloregulator ArsR/SmtB family transcription factor [bacterium]
MRIEKARQILKSFADDTRLRVINLLNKQELNVTELCGILQSSQSNLSKHLTRLRLTGVVDDRRAGLNVYYHLIKPKNRTHQELLNSITVGLADLEIFKRDIGMLKELKKSAKINATKKEGSKK